MLLLPQQKNIKMKRLNLTSFLSGIVFAIVFFTSFAFINKEEMEIKSSMASAPAPAVENITPAVAVQYRNNFKTIYPGAIEGINISVEQLETLNETIRMMDNNLTDVSGFRLYFGATSTVSSAPVVSIAYVINKQLRQNEPGSNLKMAAGFPGKYRQQCPPFCD